MPQRSWSLGNDPSGAGTAVITSAAEPVASPGQVGRSRNARSKQEGPMRFRILIDLQNLSYTRVSGHFRLLTGSGGMACATDSFSLASTTNPLRKIPLPVERLYAASARRGNRSVPSGRKGSRALSIALMTSAWAAAVSSVIRQSDQPTVFSGRPGPVRPISVASATNRLLWYRCPRCLCRWPAKRAALECRGAGPARRIRRTRQPATPKVCPGHPPDRRVW